MPKPVAISQFLPTLLIPKSDRTLLQELATMLVKHNFDEFTKFGVTKDGRPDSRQWIRIRKTKRIRIYQERRCSKHFPSPISSLLSLGSVTGRLEDVMNDTLASLNKSSNFRSSCIHVGLVDSQVLEELVSPTTEDPYHHVSLQWRLFNDRDYVTLDTTGMMKTPWGERIGYNISHSVGFSQLPEFTTRGISRGNMSVCSIYSQKAQNIVECYTRGFYDRSTDTHNHAMLALQNMTSRSLSLSCRMECMHMKKFARHLRKYKDDSGIVHFTQARSKQKCLMCAESLLSFLTRSKKTCRSCSHNICSM
ncbi:hypothetical protein Plhal703r1_c06g0032951 [Plasmopara halstedii]